MTCQDDSQGTDNLGFDDVPVLSAKAALTLKLNALIDQRGLSDIEAATAIGMSRSKVSKIRRYKIQSTSLDRLMQALVALDQSVEIVAQPARRAYAPGITIAA